MSFEEELKRRAKEEPLYVPQGFEERMENLARTLTEEEKPVKKQAVRTAALAAALCAALVGTALAASPGLREALGQLLRGFESYVQTVEGTVARAEGIEIRMVSALSDGNAARLYLEVADLEGDRLDGKTCFDVELQVPGEERWHHVGYSSGSTLQYDPEEGAALMEMQLETRGEPIRNMTVRLEISHLVSGAEWVDVPFPTDVVLTGETLDCRTLAGGRVVLEPGQTRRELETDHYALSSLGFGSDGRLHFLYEILDENFNPEESLIRCGLGSREDRAVLESGRPTDCPRESSYNNGAPAPVLFREGEGLYYDVCSNAGPEDLEDLILSDRLEGWFCNGVAVEGPWVLEVSLENAPARELTMDPGTLVNGVEAYRLTLAAMGASIESDLQGRPGALTYPLTVFLADGGRQEQLWCNGMFRTGTCTVNNWVFREPVDPEQVTGVAVGMWYIPIEGDRALPGYWLPEPPWED